MPFAASSRPRCARAVPLGHLGRGLLSVGGMFTNFSALTRLPLADATAISFASPLITVALAAIILKERVRYLPLRRHFEDREHS